MTRYWIVLWARWIQMRLHVSSSIIMKISVFWVAVTWSLVKTYRCFRCVHFSIIFMFIEVCFNNFTQIRLMQYYPESCLFTLLWRTILLSSLSSDTFILYLSINERPTFATLQSNRNICLRFSQSHFILGKETEWYESIIPNLVWG